MNKYKSLPIKDWSLEDRPREKLMAIGESRLSNAELLAILITSGNQSETAVDLAKKILNSVNNSIHELGKLSKSDLTKIKGIGEVKALSIIAALELGRRRRGAEVPSRIKISGSRDVFEMFQPLLGDLPHEEFWILLLNRSNRVLDKIKISQGGIAGTVIDARVILKHSIDKLASSMILCHNHPSGNLQPSDADQAITKKMKESSSIMDIQVLDHLIVADNSYFSFSDEGLL